jgi:hypothetical protein
MYKLGKLIGSLVNLSLYVGIIYDGIWNFRHHNSFVLDIFAFIFFVGLKDVVKSLSVTATATEFIAWYFVQQNEKDSKKEKLNNIFHNITKDL